MIFLSTRKIIKIRAIKCKSNRIDLAVIFCKFGIFYFFLRIIIIYFLIASFIILMLMISITNQNLLTTVRFTIRKDN